MNIPLLLARRQKRLQYWQEKFSGASCDTLAIISDLLATYKLLIAKMATTKDETERSDCESRLETIERELTTNFESRRLMTTTTGVPAIEESTQAPEKATTLH